MPAPRSPRDHGLTGAPLRLWRDLGKRALTLAQTRGTGRRCRNYRNALRALIKLAHFPRVAVVGVGDCIEVIAAIDGLRGTALGPAGMHRSLYVIARESDVAAIERAQRYHKLRGEVVTLAWPINAEANRLLARGDFWFSFIVISPCASAEWSIEALRTLRGLCRSDTTIIVCRPRDSASQHILAALAGFGWGGVTLPELALLQRHGGPQPKQGAAP